MDSASIFSYTPQELEALRARDARLCAAIDRIGPVERAVIPDPFMALIHSIVGQQISSAAHRTVWARLNERIPDMTPAGILSAGADVLRGCGLSGRKAGYILGAAGAVAAGALDIAALKDLPDDAVVQRLIALPGVGKWTAEMLLIFSLQRRDVMSYADFGIRKGLCTLYDLPELTQAQFNAYRQRFSPHGSLASLYLWEIAAGK